MPPATAPTMNNRWRTGAGGHTIPLAAPFSAAPFSTRARNPLRASWRRGFLACCAIGARALCAEPIPWLYDVQIPVASQTDAVRQRATRQALTEVLVRATGGARVHMVGAVAEALAQPARYTLRYQFTSATPPASRGAPPMPNESGLLFDVRFDADAVLALLRDARLPIWGANRPTVLAWLAVRAPGRDEVVDSAGDGWAAALNRRARHRGIAVALPLMDLRDLEISTAAVWGFFWEHIEAASRRYGADLLLVGRATLERDGWRTDWELREADRSAGALEARDQLQGAPITARHSQPATTLQGAAEAAIDHVADTLAARFAVRGDLAHAFQATVRGAQTARGYAALLDHLGGQEYIERVDVLAATPSSLDIRLHTRSELGQLAELLAQDGRLAVTPAGGRMDVTWLGRK